MQEGKIYEENEMLKDRICIRHCALRGADGMHRGRATTWGSVCGAPIGVRGKRRRGTAGVRVLPRLPGLLQQQHTPIRISGGPYLGNATRTAARFGWRAVCLAVGETRFPRLTVPSSRGGRPAVSETLGAAGLESESQRKPTRKVTSKLSRDATTLSLASVGKQINIKKTKARS